MKKFKSFKKNRLNEIPRQTGIYLLINKKEEILYIGKANNLRERVKNHFQSPSYKDEIFIKGIEEIGFIETDSEIEALILESQLIKRHRPRFNSIWKDDKNYSYVAIAKEKLPIVFITHQLENSNFEYIGPFIDSTALKQTLKILRRVFPYYTTRKHPKKRCGWCHLNLCPGPDPDIKKYRENIKDLKSILKNGKNSVLKDLNLKMKKAAEEENFEKAAELKNKLISLEKIFENAKVLKKNQSYSYQKTEELLHNILNEKKSLRLIEGYDISNIQGKLATGSMVVFESGKPLKSRYRKFRIRIENNPNDTAMIGEVITRRLKHEEWIYPDLILIDGGKGQLNAALVARQHFKDLYIPIVSLAKKNNELFMENQKNPLLLKNLPKEVSNLILRIRDEAHRFAIEYHRKLREKAL